MFLKKSIATILRFYPLNAIYCFTIRILLSLGYQFSFPLIVNKRVKIFFDKNNFFFMHPKGLDTIAARVYFNGFEDFEFESIREFTQLINGKATFFDIGANTGYYSLLARSINKDISVHGFEPVPEIHKNFKLNCSLNNYENSISSQEIALTDFNGKINFDLPVSINFATGGSTNSAHRLDTKSFQCTAMTLDSYCEKNEIHKIDIMKIDTESTEPSVLAGGLKILTHSRPIMIIEILSKDVGLKIMTFLEPLNYNQYAMTSDGLVSCEPDTWEWERHTSNYLFIPK